ncbi:MAG: hypothetical protein IPN95_23430 [Bacteroidetes bacterium]|nr:hypothetical protein [Bacteroidota bacterium]MBL0018859.1 hypothetical protein [Bacteroidota bacterium]MBP6640775.1 hypothetical protein [Bacteroidia bacterium]
MHRLIRLLPVVACCMSLLGCEVINPAEELPAYISIQNPMVSAPDDTSFRSNTGVRNAWLYHGGFLQGVYQIDPQVDTNGRVVPFLQLDQTDFFIEGGIYESGQSSFQIIYPFWDRVSFDWAATAGDTLEVTPVFHYTDPSKYETPVSVTFEGGGVDFDRFASGLPDTATFFVTSATDPYRGLNCGRVDFLPGERYFEVINTVPFRSTQALNIFAEITYQNTIPFTVGLIYGSRTSPNRLPIMTISPSGTWNTVYVHMITEVRNIINALGPNTDLWLWMIADGENKEGYIRFDDIRVIKEK